MPTSSNESIPNPFSYAPSQLWDGNDGSWSSFIVRIGTPPQDFRVFPSTTGQETLIPFPEGCTSSDPSSCGELRGVMPAQGVQGTGYATNVSSTWDLIGVYTTNLEDILGYVVDAEYGLESVGLQLENSGGLSLNELVVGGIAVDDFYLGVFGLGPKPSNFSTYSNPLPSFMTRLNSTKLIPSLSYGYTAGASYRFSKVLGSLTLGGYDSSRFEVTDLTIPFASDDSRPLQVAIQTIAGDSTLLGTVSLSTTTIFANIDSTLPYLWLPRSTCDQFEDAFGLTYDNETELYIVNDTIHTKLISSNPVVTFKLANSALSGTFQNIELPYAAFDLQASYPIYENATNYFPIRCAANDTQYTLGRAFLQEAYLIADYERKNFTVAQANFSATMPDSSIVAIISPGYDISGNSTNDEHGVVAHHSLSTGAIAGIAVGAIAAVIMIAIGLLMYLRNRRHREKGQTISTTDPDAREAKSTPEADGSVNRNELMADGAQHELPSPPVPQPELQGDTLKWGRSGVQELHADYHKPPELDGEPLETPPGWIHEAEGSPGRLFELPGHEVETDRNRRL